MQSKFPRTLVRALSLAVIINALPIAFVGFSAEKPRVPSVEISEACALGDGKCRFELLSICGSDSLLHYHEFKLE